MPETQHEPLSPEESALAWVAIAYGTLTDGGPCPERPEDHEILSVSRQDTDGKTKLTVELIWAGQKEISTHTAEVETNVLDDFLKQPSARSISPRLPHITSANSA